MVVPYTSGVPVTFESGEFVATFSVSDGYVRTTEVGELMTGAEMRRYMAALERFVVEAGVTSVLFDARRDGPPRVGDQETREARWQHLAGPSRIARSAVVVESDLAVARVNMTARARKVVLQAFVEPGAALAWLVAS